MNLGHGHVKPRPDGMRARCGGPGLCAECSREKAQLEREPKGLDLDRPHIYLLRGEWTCARRSHGWNVWPYGKGATQVDAYNDWKRLSEEHERELQDAFNSLAERYAKCGASKGSSNPLSESPR